MSLGDFLVRYDKIISSPACLASYLLSGFALSKATDNALIIRPGGMGDLICCHIALELLNINPKDIFWVIEKRSSAWAKLHKFKYFCYDDFHIKDFINIRGRFSLVINSEQHYGLSQALAFYAKARNGKLLSFDTCIKAQYATATVEYVQNMHEVNNFATLFKKAFSVHLDLLLKGAPRLRKQAARGYVLIAVGGALSPSRNMSADFWVEIIERFGKGRNIYISGASSDIMIVSSVLSKLPEITLVSGNFEIFTELLSGADEVITIDSGAVHIASYYGVPTKAIFTSGNDIKWAPIASGSQIFINSACQCRPCNMWGRVKKCTNMICKTIDF